MIMAKTLSLSRIPVRLGEDALNSPVLQITYHDRANMHSIKRSNTKQASSQIILKFKKRGNEMTTKATILKTIRKHCIECAGGSVIEVEMCTSGNCNLYLYSFGKDPEPTPIDQREWLATP